jgi:hypothetical protein
VGFLLLGYELSLPSNNSLIPKEEIEKEIDPLWSIKIRQQNLGICKDFDEKIILEANLSISVRLQ